MCAIYGGTFMLNTDIEEILFDESGNVSGVRNGDKVKIKFLMDNLLLNLAL